MPAVIMLRHWQAPSAPEYEEVGDGRALAIEIAKEVDMLKGKDIIVLHVAPIVSWYRPSTMQLD